MTITDKLMIQMCRGFLSVLLWERGGWRDQWVNHVAVVNIDPSGRQGMINYRLLKNIAPGKIGQTVCEITHRWSIYLSALCDDLASNRYLKSIEVAPDGTYLSDYLEEVIEHCYSEIRASANPQH